MKKSVIKVLSLTICFLMLFAIPGCGGGAAQTPSTGQTPTPAPGPAAGSSQPSTAAPAPPPPENKTEVEFAETINFIQSVAISQLNSHSVSGIGADHNNAIRMVFDSLYYNEPDGKSIPMLATHYESDDYETWIFYLRDDVYWHNGDKFTAHDVIYTWQSACDNPATQAGANWHYIKEASIIDDYTVKFVTDGPYNSLLFNLGINVSYVINQKAIEADPFNGYHVGTGAYKVAEFSPSDYMLFERNEDYWGEPAISKYQKWTLVTEASVRTIMLQNGTADLGGVQATDLPLFEADPNFHVHSFPSNNPQSLIFNTKDPIAGDWDFRMAVAYALDTLELSEFGSPGGHPVYDGAIWGQSVQFKNESIPFLEPDIEKAKEHLAKSVYKGEEIELVTTAASGTAMNDMAVAMIDMLGAIGIKIVLNVMDPPTFGTYTDPLDNKSQLSIYFGRMGQNPVDTYWANFYPGSANNRANYSNPEVTAMLDRIPMIIDENEQREIYYKMQEIVTNDRPMIPIFWMPSTVVYADGVGGFITTANVMYDWRYTYRVLK